MAGAFATRDVLDRFGGGRVINGVTSTPFKHPPAPSETALLAAFAGHGIAWPRTGWSRRRRDRQAGRRPPPGTAGDTDD
ncbi:hypothetical protein [Frankia tisae]|uniref:hypothetical protein n=1 Tax=Frankia tisae TaxID=2950104 RepID=UPI0021BF3CFD|nr:hypothetical protein [Frankia tisae]